MEERIELPWFVKDCDPGIQEAVVKCLDAGFHTTDSGDGESKRDENGELPLCAIGIPNVMMLVEDKNELISECERLKELFPDWSVEAGYNPDDGLCTLIMTKGQWIPDHLKSLLGEEE